MPENYASDSEVIRNLSSLKSDYEVVHTDGSFRIVRLAPPFLFGSEFWVVNEKGFLWEPVPSMQQGLEYLRSDEARAYQSSLRSADEPPA